MKRLDKFISYGLYLFVFLLPWQTRWIFKDASLNGEVWEYGRLSMYGTEILLLVLLILNLVRFSVLYINKAENRFISFKKELNGILLGIILFSIWSAITIFWSSDKQLAWHNWVRLMEGIGLFWLITQSGVSFNKIKWALLGAGVVQSLLAIWQWLAQISFASKWLGMSFLNPATLGVSVVENGVGRFLRVYGSLPHPNILAGFLVVCLMVAIIMVVQQKKDNSTSLLLGIIAILTMGLFLTFSRAGWLVLALSLFIYWVICLTKKINPASFFLASNSTERRGLNLKKLFWATLTIIVVFETLSWFYVDLVSTRLVSERRLEVKSNQERLEAYNDAQVMIKENWLLGVGSGQYTLTLFQKNSTLPAWAYQPVHDSHVLILAELGIIGLLLFALVIINAIKSGNEYWLLLLTVLCLGVFDHYFRSFYFGVMLWWLVIALSVKLSKSRTKLMRDKG